MGVRILPVSRNAEIDPKDRNDPYGIFQPKRRVTEDELLGVYGSKQGAHPQSELDPEFARKNLWKREDWYDLPEHLRTAILDKSRTGV